MSEPKIALITGANNGIGLVAATRLAAANIQVVMICRSQTRGEAAIEEIERRTGHRPVLLLADLLSQAQVREAAQAFTERFGQLHMLINHAGFAFAERQLTAEGFERTFALNYLAYFTLTMELLPQLLAAPGARIVNTASNAHTWAPLDFDNLQGERSFPKRRFPPLPLMYGWTNMARIMFTYELARRLAPAGITATCHCPGFVPVKRSGSSRLQNAMMWFFSLMPSARTADQGADTIEFLATAPEAAVLSGVYYRQGQLAESHPQTHDLQARQKLWQETLQLTGYPADPVERLLSKS